MTPRHDNPQRDERLGAALRALAVPEHAPDFAARLRGELQRRPAPGIARRRRGVHARPTRWPRLGLTLAAAVAAVVVALLLLPGSARTPAGRLGAEPATAAQLGARVTLALASVDALSAVLVLREHETGDGPLVVSRQRVLLTSAGDLRIEGPRHDVAYHADSGTETVLRDPRIPGASVTTALAPGPPDRALDRIVQLGLGSVARALRAAGSAPVRQTRFAGRSAWRIAMPAAIDVHALPGETGDRLDAIVDRATGIPLRVRETYRGRLVSERRLQDVRIDPRIPARVFAPVALRDGVERFDAGFVPRALRDARAAVGYAPLAPRWLPAGFARAETATAATAMATGAEGMNPPSAGVVSTAYRRGLQQFVLSTRRAGADVAAWADPLAAPEGFLVKPRRICFTHGALAGACGQQLIAPRATTHVWAIANGLVVTVAGDLTASQLRRVAESLTPLR